MDQQLQSSRGAIRAQNSEYVEHVALAVQRIWCTWTVLKSRAVIMTESAVHEVVKGIFYQCVRIASIFHDSEEHTASTLA